MIAEHVRTLLKRHPNAKIAGPAGVIPRPDIEDALEGLSGTEELGYSLVHVSGILVFHSEDAD